VSSCCLQVDLKLKERFFMAKRQNAFTRCSAMNLWSALFATIVLLLGSTPAPTQDVPVQIRFAQYSAKFLCGTAKDDPEHPAGVRPGTYETSINLHNPEPFWTQQPVYFAKKVVLSPREKEKPRFPIGWAGDELAADFADHVDCKIIRALLGIPASDNSFIEGFVVLIVLPIPWPTEHELDVVGVYTVDTPQGSISLEMMPIVARIQTLSGTEGRKLTDELLEHSKPK